MRGIVLIVAPFAESAIGWLYKNTDIFFCTTKIVKYISLRAFEGTQARNAINSNIRAETHSVYSIYARELFFSFSTTAKFHTRTIRKNSEFM